MDNNNNLPVRKHLPHHPPPNVSQHTVGAPYFITICVDRKYYGGLRTNRPTTTQSPAHYGGLRTNRPTIAPLTTNNAAIKILSALEHYRTKGLVFPRLAVVMPDHVHLIATFPESTDMTILIRNWKRWIARETGVVWQDGFFDHRMRNDAELSEKLAYVANNPVRKGLCETPDEWPFRQEWR